MRRLVGAARQAAPLAAVLACALGAGAAGAEAAQADSSAGGRRGGVQAFLLTGAPDSFADLRAHARSVSVVYPTYYECAPGSGRVQGADVPALDAFARAHRIALLPRFTCQDGASVHRILTEPALRAATLARLARLARARAFDGLCLDLENDGASDRGALSAFVARLAQLLHEERRRLTVVVDGVSTEPAPGSSLAFYDDRAIAAAADTVFVLAWGAHWEGSAPGPLAPLSYVRGVVRYVASLAQHARFVVGAPMYGLDWGEAPGAAAGAETGDGGEGAAAVRGKASAYQYAAIRRLARSVGARAVREGASGEMTFSYASRGGVRHRVWYMDARSVLDVLALARASGLGVGVWRLGEEDQSLWSSALLAPS